ncbi:type I secretion protein [Aurantimonas sp. A2-1-M11]|uniref:type I secretion protein n=1 Tax=Aurantimonas sp. A2-1-M11 TaxID=3113712 RepID=UPI002F95DB7C
MDMDKTTEAIAHFIGLFEVILDETRLREAHDEFNALRAMHQENPELVNVNVKVSVPYQFASFDPHISYMPKAPELVRIEAGSRVDLLPPDVPSSFEHEYISRDSLPPPVPIANDVPIGQSSRLVLPQVEPAGSVAILINQKSYLQNNDYVSVGGHGLTFAPESNNAAALAGLVAAAEGLDPVHGLQAPSSLEDLKDFVTTVTASLKAHVTESGDGADVFTLHSHVIEGIYVSGSLVAEAPVLAHYLSEDDEEDLEEEGSKSNNSATVLGDSTQVQTGDSEQSTDFKASVTLETGGNALVNTVDIVNNWLVSPVFAVIGDSFEINAVVQINVWSDNDLVSASIGGWSLVSDNPTEALNIAAFKRTDPSMEDEGAPAPTGDFPKHWVVTELKGDLLILNWIEQFAFMMDEDVAVLSASGITMSVLTGGNAQANAVSIFELGYNYDLIIVGGSVYDANIIHQMNVLFDNDVIGAVAGFQTSGEGSVASSNGNLLWNQAEIHNIGGAARFETLPEHYRKTAENLEKGEKLVEEGVLKDADFLGVGVLKVLYISGDYLNVNYVKQTTVLGDGDHVALAMDALNGTPDAIWDVSLGSNNLVNMASITDVDALGKTYVGGEQYSDEILIQAELISSDPHLGGQDPDVLVNEAIAFLDDDLAGPEDGLEIPQSSLAPDSSQADVMQSMLA